MNIFKSAANGIAKGLTVVGKNLKGTSREEKLQHRLKELNVQLESIKGWGPETAAQRRTLFGEKRQIITELNHFAAGRR